MRVRGVRHAARASRFGASADAHAAARVNPSVADWLFGRLSAFSCLAYRINFDTIGDKTMARQQIQVTLGVRFFRTASGNEPVREWIRALEPAERRAIGEEIKTVQLGWPLGMPLVRKMSQDLWEIRIMLPRRIARVLFTVVGDTMVLLHGFIKQSSATPSDDLDVTLARLKALARAI